MPHTFTRQELFDLVWSEPTRTIAKRLGISDVGLAKACRKADLLLPPRGYWAKLAFGKKVQKPAIPPRRPGMSNDVVVGQDRWGWSTPDIDISAPDPPLPSFPEPLESVEEKVRKQIGRVKPTRDLAHAHSRVQKLLAADEHRRAKQRESPYNTWDPPLFESATEQRRLRILSSLMRALDPLEVFVSVEDKEARKFVAHVADYGVAFSLESTTTRAARSKSKSDTLMLRMMNMRGSDETEQSWSDSDEMRLESQLADIAIAIVVHGERSCRRSSLSYREWLIERKQELIAEAHKKEQERLRKDREHRERLEKARVGRLLAQAENLRKAQDIRAYVQAVEALQASSDNPMSAEERHDWRTWALAQADHIDPVVNGAYRNVVSDPREVTE